MRYFDRSGKAITFHEAGLLLEKPEYIRVGKTSKDDVTVSTVWLGLDHSWGAEKGPLIFETMVFGGEYNDSQWRYSTLADAIEGHEAACREIFGE